MSGISLPVDLTGVEWPAPCVNQTEQHGGAVLPLCCLRALLGEVLRDLSGHSSEDEKACCNVHKRLVELGLTP
jgi:hypothetical protein